MIRFAEVPAVSPPIPQRSCRVVAVERIADAIRELAGSGEPVTFEAMEARGIPQAVAERYAEDARALARRRFNRRA